MHIFKYLIFFMLLTTACFAQTSKLETRDGDQSVIVRWEAIPNAPEYAVFRAKGSGAFEAYRTTNKLAFTDFAVTNNETYHYQVRVLGAGGSTLSETNVATAKPKELSENEFLDLVQRTAFDYFWYEANPENGLIKDRSTDASPSSIAAVGFGLSGITVAIDRGWISREAGRKRVLTTLRFFWNAPQSATDVTATGHQGFFYHFLDMKTGKRMWLSELSTIDTALLLGGVLHARQFFAGTDAEEMEIRKLSDDIYGRVNWPWTAVRPPKISMGWKPESGFLGNDWNGYNEAMIIYLLAMGSPKYPMGGLAWEFWTRSYSWQHLYGYSFLTFPPLFGHQYSHVWVDFRKRQDQYMRDKGIDYFENSRRATLAQRNYAIANPLKWQDYGENVWGLTASDVPTGYSAHGAPPAQNDHGTIVPTAAGGSVPFAPTETIATLRELYKRYRVQLWDVYGFKDAINPSKSWTARDYIGIDQGPILLMIENYRTGKVWKAMMQHESILKGLEKAGFTGTGVANESEIPVQHFSLSIYPNPSQISAQLSFQTAETGFVVLEVHDLLGKQMLQRAELLPAGEHSWSLVTQHWAQGVYVVQLSQNGQKTTRKMVVSR